MEEGLTYRVCNKCGEEKPLTREYWYRHRECVCGFDTSSCKNCRKIHTKEWSNNNIEHIKKYRNKNKEHDKIRLRKLRSTYPVSYVKAMIKHQCGLPYEEINPELIELKHQQLRLYHNVKKIRRLLNGSANESIGREQQENRKDTDREIQQG
jgi:hypothetical protein